MSKTVLIETFTPEEARVVTKAVTDEKTGKRNWYLEGICMQSTIQNRNKRVYPREEIVRAVETLQESIRGSQCYGELDHPSDSRVAVELKHVSHMFVKLEMQGDNAIGKMKLLETANGTIAIKILEGGGRIGVSTRGRGDVMEGGYVANFDCSCIDLVATPSAPHAMPESIYEAMEQDKQGRLVKTLAETYKEDPIAQKFLDEEVKKFLYTLLKI